MAGERQNLKPQRTRASAEGAEKNLALKIAKALQICHETFQVTKARIDARFFFAPFAAFLAILAR